MTAFVLVPGAFLGGWCWKRVADRLRQEGHDVYPVTLTGVGERAHLMSPSIGFDTHVRDVEAVIEFEGLTDAVLCGQSYGGLVITAVADANSDKIAALVYLDALIGQDGKSMLDLMPEEFRAALSSGSGDTAPPFPSEALGVGEADRSWVDAKSTGHPVRSFKEPLSLTGAWRRVEERHYIRAPEFPHASLDRDLAASELDPAWQTHTLSGGHNLMIDNPDGVAEILLSAA